MKNIDKFRGCLIGGAAGDALGYAVEFLREAEIFRRYGEKGITDYALTHGKALISDDTQMTLFTANGLLVGTTRGMMRGIMGEYDSYISIMYKCWYRTQTERYPITDTYQESWLLDIPELYSRRAPGITCMNAISNGCEGTIERPINDSKGCGGIMRVAPIGLYFSEKSMSYEKSDLIGAKASACTHGHELGYIPSAALVHIIRKLVEEPVTIKEAVADALKCTEKMFRGSKHIDYFTALINKAISLAETSDNDLDAIHQLGEGWVAEETLAIAVYCALKYADDFEKAVVTAVNHNGDSDSTGAVLGNILGTYIGYANIPQKYKENLELSEIILETADDLYNDCQMSEYDTNRDEAWAAKYIECRYKK
ncbi:MAG: ADP-ribosylglycohydrolase family protein [Oscillospiraceae bacterium]|nr:ADP-ribosylglycohydrolase family protein [Oscillospiraceae bacterium]